MVEVDKALFSIEPMIKTGDSLYNWSNVKAVQSMGFPDEKRGFKFVPSVTWQCDDLKFVTGDLGQRRGQQKFRTRYRLFF